MRAVPQRLLALLLVMVVAGCGATSAPSSSGTAFPSPTAASATTGPQPNPASGQPVGTAPRPTSSLAPTPEAAAAQAVVPCRPDAASLAVVFESPFPSPVPIPATLPAGLPGDLIPAGASVYGVGVPAEAQPGSPAWYFYTAGPPGLDCRVQLGNYIDVTLSDAARGARIDLEFPLSEGPNQLLSCRYIAVARVAAAPFAASTDCRPGPTDRVTALTTASPRDHVALVNSPAASPTGGDPTIALYEYWEIPPSGASVKIECQVPPGQRSTCLAAFALFVAQQTLGSTPPAQLVLQLERLLS